MDSKVSSLLLLHFIRPKSLTCSWGMQCRYKSTDVQVEGESDVFAHRECLLWNTNLIDEHGPALKEGMLADPDEVKGGFASLHKCCICKEERAAILCTVDTGSGLRNYWFHVPCAIDQVRNVSLSLAMRSFTLSSYFLTLD